MSSETGFQVQFNQEKGSEKSSGTSSDKTNTIPEQAAQEFSKSESFMKQWPTPRAKLSLLRSPPSLDSSSIWTNFRSNPFKSVGNAVPFMLWLGGFCSNHPMPSVFCLL
uniref:Uncharacterized protein n=1 Tax=Ditylenchus dipsaci TaxID=166011 RepID=A0A915EJV3_9BILA